MRSLVLMSMLLVTLAGAREAAAVVISTAIAAEIGGVSFDDDDLVDYDIVANLTASPNLFEGSSEFALSENIDAVHVFDSQNILLSTQNGATLGGTSIQNGDLVEYNIATNVVASVVFDESMIGVALDINAASVLPNGDYVLSTTTGETLPAPGMTTLDVDPDDLFVWDPDSMTATLFFEGDMHFALGEDIDAVHVLADGTLVLSTDNNATLGAGAGQLSFDEATLIHYDPASKVAMAYLGMQSSKFAGGESSNIDAVSLPEPSMWSLLALGLVLLARRRA